MSDTPSNDPGGEDEDILYDLAGNPMPSQPKRTPEPPNPVSSSSASVDPAARPHAPPAYQPASGARYPSPQPIQPPQEPKMPRWVTGAGIGLFICVIIVGALLHRPHEMALAVAPAFAPYTSADKTVVCDAPVGWKTTDSGVEGAAAGSSVFEQESAKIDISDDVFGSIVNDIGAVPGAETLPKGQDMFKPPVTIMHELDKKKMAKKFTNYQEGTIQEFKGMMGDSCLSEWTADSATYSGKMHGYRATMVGGDRRIITICSCSEKNWPILEPAFKHVIDNIRAGKG